MYNEMSDEQLREMSRRAGYEITRDQLRPEMFDSLDPTQLEQFAAMQQNMQGTRAMQAHTRCAGTHARYALECGPCIAACGHMWGLADENTGHALPKETCVCAD